MQQHFLQRTWLLLLLITWRCVLFQVCILPLALATSTQEEILQKNIIKSPLGIISMEAAYETDIWGKVNFSPVPAYFIDTHDPVTQDSYISASVHEAKIPWDSYVWDRIVSLTPADASGLLFVDVGANLGYFSLAAASMGYHVVAFEPMSRNAKKLAKSIERNKFGPKVTLYQVAVSDESGERVVLQPANASEITSNATSALESYVYGIDYAVSITLSDAMQGKDAFLVRINVGQQKEEGTHALQGAKEWICRSVVRHLILQQSDATTEWNADMQSLLEFMKSAGYVMSDVAVGSQEFESTKTETLPSNIILSLPLGREHLRAPC